MNTIVIKIMKESDIYFAQSEFLNVVSDVNFTSNNIFQIKTIISELAYNIIKYASKGFIKISKIEDRGKIGVLISATDKGPGIKNISNAMQDHYSSSGTLGLGLPGIKRMADSLKIESSKENGTQVIVKYWKS
jgi:serine/threonine-protein kinase RsbT